MKGRRKYGSPAYNRGAAAAATALSGIVFHPFDTIKVRIQMGQGPNFHLITNMLRNGGIASFYKGLSAGLLSQVTSSAVCSYSLKYVMVGSYIADGGNLINPYYRQLFCSLTGSAIGAVVCNPAELAMTRMQGDASLPSALRRNYKNLLQALYQTASKEGIQALWNGSGPSALRTMSLTIGLRASSESFNIFRRYTNDFKINLLVGILIYGIVPPACSSPFDYVKTQMQMMQPDATGRYPYAGPLDCAMKTLKFGGPLKFYTGFVVQCFKFFPQSLLIVMLYDRVFKGVNVSFRV
ncbi:OLC1v1007467C1 [Oldenlandia corymbosa var. corymbosa]|uniref:OLC1v1007467C1 n=1 Tax=Oldenlandia corymbosa var. corymbosa TaxID=529605 RepID=A0AAV1DLR9_OLDCO|nr:OLC1v1007467C1 [Oldenlandia corymbosa var. corymbosa]